MENNCKKCKDLDVTLGWSARPMITERGSGEILASAYIDRLLNADFYPADKKPEEALGDWPTCPDCGKPLPIEEREPIAPMLPDLNFNNVYAFLAFLFLALLLLLLAF